MIQDIQDMESEYVMKLCVQLKNLVSGVVKDIKCGLTSIDEGQLRTHWVVIVF